MQISDIKKELIQQPDKIVELLEFFDFTKITINKNEIRFARDRSGGLNISIRLIDNEHLSVSDFARSVHSDIISYIIQEKNSTFKDVLQKIKEILGLDDTWEPAKTVELFSGRFDKIKRRVNKTLATYDDSILDQYSPYGSWRFYKDHISVEAQQFYSVRYDVASGRIIFPWRDEHGNIVAIKGRLNKDDVENQPKYLYLYPNNISQCLFNYSESYEYLYDADTIYVLESEKSCMQLYTMGIRNCVAIGSHSVSDQQAKLLLGLNPKNIVVMMDEGLEMSEIRKNIDTINRNKGILKNCNVKWFDYRNCQTIGHKDSPSDNGREIWDDIVKNHIKNDHDCQ